MKWLITRPGARWYLTTSAPRIACPITPSGSSAPKRARCQRNGRRKKASTAAAITAKPTKPVRTLLPYSITAWVSSGGTVPP